MTISTNGTTGQAQVYYSQPATGGTTSVVRVTAGHGTGVATPEDFTLFTSALSGYWKLNENTGTVANDASPSTPKNNGALVNDPVWVESFDTSGFHNDGADSALSFDGANQYVAVLHAEALNAPGASFTAAAWVKLKAGSTLGADDVYPILSKWSASGGGYELSLRGSTNGLSFRIMSSGSPAANGEISPAADLSSVLSDGLPHLVVFTRDNANMGRLYVDRVEVASRAAMASGLNSTSPLWIARNNAVPAN